MSNDNRWSKPASPPPPLFFNDKERDLVRQVNNELIERVIGQDLLYYPISLEHSNFHPLYGECMKKTFLPPIRVYALVDWEGSETESKNGTTDRRYAITVHFHTRRLQEDQDLYVQEGDFIHYGDDFYEIVSLNAPRIIFGQTEWKTEIVAKCIKAREDTFDAL